MPQLPSGISLALSRQALFDHGGNWFNCPEGHFWFWEADPEMGSPPFDLDQEILLVAQHVKAPRDQHEVKQFIQVLEMDGDGTYGWRGEWLSNFPRYFDLCELDAAAWNAWLDRPEMEEFLNDTIAECHRLVEVSRGAKGYATMSGANKEPDADGWYEANLRIPSKSN